MVGNFSEKISGCGAMQEEDLLSPCPGVFRAVPPEVLARSLLGFLRGALLQGFADRQAVDSR